MIQKRAITIQDISCIGRCSLTVALPILSAAGIETAILPTAILSTHTGGFTGYTFRDLTDDIEPICDHWQTLNLKVDALYTGYLGSEQQLKMMEKLFSDFRQENTLVMVDPAMADQGKLYPAFNEQFALGMRDLCKAADIIVPNLTEATFMLEKPYPGSDYDQDYIEDILRELADSGPSQVVLTGITFESGKLGVATYDKQEDSCKYYFREHIEGYYHGTGDIYSSALLGALLNDMPLIKAASVAVDFTVAAIQRTYAAETDRKFGVDFEHELPLYIKLLS